MATHWQDACVDAVAKLPLLRARRFSETIRVELRAFLSIRSDDSSRLVDEGGAPVRSRCHRSARALGTWLACHWWRRDGKALAGRLRRCCREAAAPPGTPVSRERSRVELRAFLQSATNPRRDDGSTDDRARLARPPIAIPSRTNWSVPVQPCHRSPRRSWKALVDVS